MVYARMTDKQMGGTHAERSFMAQMTRKLAVPVIFAWLAIACVLTLGVPSLERVGKDHSVSAVPQDAPSVQAMLRMGKVFKEFNSDNVAMIILEGAHPLGDDAHAYYDHLVRELNNLPQYVQHLQDFWADRLTAAGVQSADGTAAYVQLNLAGNQGEALANESVRAVQGIVDRTPAPPGVKTYVTGPAALIADGNESADKSLVKITAVTVAVIFVMLFFVYRSAVTVVFLLLMVGIELSAARGIISLIACSGTIGLSVYATTMLTSLVIAAGTDYGIFLLGRYHEARQAGENPETAYYTTYRGVAHVILASGLTIAGATYCLSFAHLPYFRTMGIPSAVGMLVAVVAALTLGPAVLTVGSRFGLFEPKRKINVRRWRRVGTAIVRWPAPILTAACVISLIGLLMLPGYKASYNDRMYLPKGIPANMGYAAAERHFSPASLNPELLMIESNHDMRNPADMLVLDRVAKGVFHVPGIAQVQSITRPDGTPIDHTSIPFQISMQGVTQLENLTYQRDRTRDMLTQAAEISKTIENFRRQYALQQELATSTHGQAEAFQETLATMNAVRDKIANIDDYFRPIRSYFYWEKHCYDIPACFAFRSIFESLDAVDQLNEKMKKLQASADRLDAIQPQLLSLIPEQIASEQTLRDLTLANYATMSGILDHTSAMIKNAPAMGQAFDAAKNDDFFYLPPEAFDNPDFQRGLKLFLSPDGRAARMLITNEGDPATLEGISHIEPIKNAAHEAIKGTSLAAAKLYLTGTAAISKDFRDAAKYDLMIAGISALSLVFLIMVFITRSFIAAIVIVGTVALSLGASFGLSVLVWQDIFGIQLHWVVLAMSVIVLLAVGSDYNLLLVSRLKEEVGDGFRTGIIRSMGGTGKVVTAAGLVFAFTMGSMVFSDLRILGQVGTTIGLGLLFDTLVVRSFITPSIAALLGRWFWWPQQVPRRPSYALRRLRSHGPVHSVVPGEGYGAAADG